MGIGVQNKVLALLLPKTARKDSGLEKQETHSTVQWITLVYPIELALCDAMDTMCTVCALLYLTLPWSVLLPAGRRDTP